jgi:hypothetical protein
MSDMIIEGLFILFAPPLQRHAMWEHGVVGVCDNRSNAVSAFDLRFTLP